MSVVLLMLVGAPAAVAVLAVFAGAGRGEHVGRLGMGVSACAFAGAVGLLIWVALGRAIPTVTAATDPTSHPAPIAYADRLGVVLLVLVFGVSVVVHSFARRYLRGDERTSWFFGSAGLLTAATAGLVVAGNLLTFAICWSLAGFALCLLLATYWHLPAAREGVRRTALSLGVGDLALWVAVAIVMERCGNVDMRHLRTQTGSLTSDTGLITLVAALFVVAALARSAQLPFHRWLPATLAAPTPASALLHAGVVNAGAVLLVRLSPLATASPTAIYLTFAAGAATTIYGTTLMLAKTDIKGALVQSTMGQMGFMIMTCGAGAFAAAVFHLVAHGMYKATLFLGSGSAVRRHVRHIQAPPTTSPSTALTAVVGGIAILLPAALILTAATIAHPQYGGRTGSEVLLIFGYATATWLTWGWLYCRPTVSGAIVAAVANLIGITGYLALVAAVTSFLAPAIDVPQHAVTPWLLPAVALALATVAVALRAMHAGRTGQVAKAIYVFALSAGHVVDGNTMPRTRGGRFMRPQPAHRLARSDGASS
jgi:NAD(P)H-quinone oxidoreductase subunit 5